MIAVRLAIGGIAAALLASPAVAGDKPVLSFLSNKVASPLSSKTYPISEHRYIKQFAGPTVSCGACFGYYHTQWRPWAEACNEPVPADLGPVKPGTPVEPVPALEKAKEQPPVPKPTDKLPMPMPPVPPVEKKKLNVAPPVPAQLASRQSVPAVVTPPLAVPAVPEVKPVVTVPIVTVPAVPVSNAPTIIVPLISK